MEILTSEILECFDHTLESVKYVGDDKNMMEGMGHVSICKNFVGEDYSFVEACEVMDYCKRLNIDFREYCLRRWGAKFASIPVLDYIVVNTDRHTQNYGLTKTIFTVQALALGFAHTLFQKYIYNFRFS